MFFNPRKLYHASCYNSTTHVAGAVGVEPTTARLTVECSAIELHPIRGRKRPRGPAPNIARYTRQLNSVVRIIRNIVQNGTTCCLHAQTEGRTRKPFRVGDFESPASASSAIRASINCAQTSVHGWRKRRHGGPTQIGGGVPCRRNPRLSVGATVESSMPIRRRCKSCMPRRSSSCSPK